MHIKNLNSVIVRLLGMKKTLQGRMSDMEREDLLTELQSWEQILIMEYGEWLEEILSQVYDEYCPDDEVVSPISYLYGSNLLSGDSPVGVEVHADDFPGVQARLVLLPDPVRLELYNEHFREVIWQAPVKLEA